MCHYCCIRPSVTYCLMPGGAVAPGSSTPSAEMARHRNLYYATVKKNPKPKQLTHNHHLEQKKSLEQGQLSSYLLLFEGAEVQGNTEDLGGCLKDSPGLSQSLTISIPTWL